MFQPSKTVYLNLLATLSIYANAKITNVAQAAELLIDITIDQNDESIYATHNPASFPAKSNAYATTIAFNTPVIISFVLIN